MIKVDTLKIGIPRNIITNIKKDLMKLTGFYDYEKDVETKCYLVKPEFLPLGVSKIEITEEQCIVIMSAKILGVDYFEGISKNTIERVYDILCPKYIDIFDLDSFISFSRVYIAHVTDNLKVNEPVKQYFDAFRENPDINEKYKDLSYSDHSLYFFSKNQDQRYVEKIILYNKENSLEENNDDRRFIKLLNREGMNTDKVFNDFKNVLRIESTYKNFERVRKDFNIQTEKNEAPNLKALLESNENPNKKLLLKVLNIEKLPDKKVITRESFIEHLSPKERIEFLGILTDLKNLNGKHKRVMSFLPKYHQKIKWVKRYLYENGIDIEKVDLNNLDTVFPKGLYNNKSLNKACIDEILTKLGGD